MILLFTALFYIFPIRSLLNTGVGGERITINEFSNIFQLYSAGFSLIFFCLYLMYLRAFKKDRANSKNIYLKFYYRHFFIFVCVGVFSFFLAKLQIDLKFGVTGFIYALLGPVCYVHSMRFHKKYDTNS